jgi:drug/metabolite transporter (DMT)-like permease
MTEGTLLALLAAAAFGAALVLTQRGLAHLPALAGARISVPATAVLLWGLAPWFFDPRVLDSKALAVFAGVGLFFPALVTLVTFEANRRMGPTVAGTAGSIAPLLSIGAAVLFLGEALTVRLLLAAAAVVAGLALLSSGAGDARRWPVRALWLPLAGAAMRALAQALTKSGLQLVPSPFTAALAGYTVSAALIWAVGLSRKGETVRWEARGAAWFAAAGALNGSAVLAMYAALNAAKLTVVAPIVAGYPVFTMLFSAGLLRGDRIRWPRIAGALLVVAGMALVLA